MLNATFEDLLKAYNCRIPKVVKAKYDNGSIIYSCAECNAIVGIDTQTHLIQPKYCPQCGSGLDWDSLDAE